MFLFWLGRRLPWQGRSYRRASGPPRRALSASLRLEPLEDRLALSTFLVTNTNDAGPGSLRQAILNANAQTGLNRIAFDIGSGGMQIIQPASALPAITNPVIVDGTTEPGYAGEPLITLSGAQAGSGSNGITIEAGNSTVEGLVIDYFSGSGIVLDSNGGNVLRGNYIGTDASGTLAAGNGTGITVAGSSGNQIGGTMAHSRNLISGNLGNGIVLYGIGTQDNIVQGNLIGTDCTGTAALGNGGCGVSISSGAAANTVGGTSAAARNIIAANSGDGITFWGNATQNLVQGNFIGTDSTGKAALGNAYGISIFGASTANLIGGTAPGAMNLIAGNHADGITIYGSGTTGNLIQGNDIGTDVTGKGRLPNADDGVDISNAADNTVGGTAAAAGNVIAYNGHDGVLVNGGASNAILGNSIFSSGNLGIHLANGGNNAQAAPVLQSSGRDDNGRLTVDGILNSTPGSTFTIQWFASTALDASGNAEGQLYLGSITVTTDATGRATFRGSFDAGEQAGSWITATATDPNNNTSQFSQWLSLGGSPCDDSGGWSPPCSWVPPQSGDRDGSDQGETCPRFQPG
jgi:hypothetical protein